MVIFDVSHEPRGNARRKAYAILARENPIRNTYFHQLNALNNDSFLVKEIKDSRRSSR